MVERIRSAAELEGGSEIWQGVRTTALSMVEQFCQRTGMNPAEFMSNMGWLRSESWREGVDWKGLVNWNSFNEVIFSNIADGRRGLDLRSFTRTLEEGHETFAANSVPQRAAERPVQRQEAAGPAEAEVPWRERAAAPADQPGRIAQNQAFEIVDRYSQLTDSDRIALSNIVSRGADRTLMERNLQFYRQSLVNEGRLSEDQADSLFREIGAVGDGAVAARVAGRRPGTLDTVTQDGEVRYAAGKPSRAAPRAPQGWMGSPVERQEAAPARSEVYKYSLSFSDAGRTLSTYEVVSPQPITSREELLAALRDKPAGFELTRITREGERLPLSSSDLDVFRGRLEEIAGNPRYGMALTRREGAS